MKNINGKVNPADTITKPKSVDEAAELLGGFGVRFTKRL